jgi:hypothetical protein
MKINFNDVVKLFENIGYSLSITNDEYLFATTANLKSRYSKNKYDLRIGFCEPNNKSYSYLDGKISIDREDCFDKWSKCPINLPFPENDKQVQFLIDKINWLKTEEGYKVSNEYDFDNWIKKYPDFN